MTFLFSRSMRRIAPDYSVRNIQVLNRQRSNSTTGTGDSESSFTSEPSKLNIVQNHLEILKEKKKKNYKRNFFGNFKKTETVSHFFRYIYGPQKTTLRFNLLLAFIVSLAFFGEQLVTLWVTGKLDFASFPFLLVVSCDAVMCIIVSFLWMLYFSRYVNKSAFLTEWIAIIIIALICIAATVHSVVFEPDAFPVLVVLVVLCCFNVTKIRVAPGQIIVSTLVLAVYIGVYFGLYMSKFFSSHYPVAFYLSLAFCLFFCCLEQFIIVQYLRRLFTNVKQFRNTIHALEKENKRKLDILKNIIPLEYIEKVKKTNNRFVQVFKEMNVILTDLVGFTKYASSVSAEFVIKSLNEQYSSFDRLTKEFGFEKVKTIGDSYFSISGSSFENVDEKSVLLSIRMINVLKNINRESDTKFKMRLGVSKGQCYLGVLGFIQLNFDCFGEAVFEAQRMERLGKPNIVHVTEKLRTLTKDKFIFEINKKTGNSYFVKSVIHDNLVYNKKAEKAEREMRRRLKRKRKKKKKKKNVDYVKFVDQKCQGSEGVYEELDRFERCSRHSSFSSSPSVPSTSWGSSIPEPTKKNVSIFYLCYLKKISKIRHVYKNQDGVLKITFIMITCLFLFFIAEMILIDYKSYCSVSLIMWYAITVLSALISFIFLFVSKSYIVGLFFSVLEIGFTLMFLFVYILLYGETSLKARVIESNEQIHLNILLVVCVSFVQFNLIVIPFFFKLLIIIMSTIAFWVLDFYLNGSFGVKFIFYFCVSIIVEIFAFYNIEFTFFKHYFIQNKNKKKLLKLKTENKENEGILRSSLPSVVIERLKNKRKSGLGVFDNIKDGTICFINISNLNNFLGTHAIKAISCLNELFSYFDHELHIFGCHKIKSIGSTYIFISGIEKKVDHETKILNCALSILSKINFFLAPYKDKLFSVKGKEIGLRIGIHNGSFHAGVVGETKFLYDVFGDSVNVASRMCELSEINKIQICSEKLVSKYGKEEYKIEERGNVHVKGKGLVDTFYVSLGKKTLKCV